ncbi:hypothetical protein RRG08_003573 [Elysia crispata]|uniref:Uncharacterized protein n=1 Tax=Elysia crispata TaxID=231223 RepID=A0AAE0YI10_9GAST|nr:hypothetical protein RRG08_003573 [Elysia crispata]
MADAVIKTENSHSPQIGRQRSNSDPKPSVDAPTLFGTVVDGSKGDSTYLTSGSSTTPRPVKYTKGAYRCLAQCVPPFLFGTEARTEPTWVYPTVTRVAVCEKEVKECSVL